MQKIMLTAEEGNGIIYNKLSESGPFMAARFGSVEFNCVMGYLHGKWDNRVKSQMGINAGFFPIEDWALKDFCKIIIENLSLVDLMAEWLNESALINYGVPKILTAQLRCVEPYYHRHPWSKALEGKRVLVIHPFEESIKIQHKKGELLFINSDIFPKFELETIKAVQSIAGSKTKFKTWFEALDSMKHAIYSKDFDVAIIGAGAYGLPLAGFVKSIGKKVVHMGGATQILFGIKGKRWDAHEDISKLYNENWIRPSLEETPQNFIAVEGGTYW